MALEEYSWVVEEISDPRVSEWPLMASPWPTLAFVLLYLYTVVLLIPRIMANRKPFQMRGVLVVYNTLQVLVSLAMLWEVSTHTLYVILVLHAAHKGRAVIQGRHSFSQNSKHVHLCILS